MTTTKKAGAIVLSQKNPELIALLYRARQNDWSFPKGHVEEGEEIASTMRREVMEETGLSVRILSAKIPSMEYKHPKGDFIVVYMFLMQSEDDAALRPEFDGDKIIWINYKEVADKLSYDNIKDYFTAIFPTVENVIIKLKQNKIHGF